MSTPLRSLDAPLTADGTRHLHDPRIAYRDGGEQRVIEILSASEDLSSTSTELLAAAKTWPEEYHLSPQRRVLLEFLDIRPDQRVLEIGAGCGALTRFLGESGAIVDAVEPMPTRAKANRLRCRDLDTVEVFVGEVRDIPDEPAYDLAIVVGVLEYVGDGGADPAPYLEFLSGLQRRLVDGGQLLLAIENRFGVKYLAGSAEDHTARMFDGIEGYPHQRYPGQPGHASARTFSRRGLLDLVTEAGFRPGTVLAAFPDYKMPRVVYSDALYKHDASLAHRIPTFPSPDRAGARPKLVDEYSLWRGLVEAGAAADFPNSFVVCAAKGTPERPIWPAGRLAGFASLTRAPGYAASTVLETGDAALVYRRRHHGTATDPEVVVGGADIEHVPGRDLIEVLAEADDARLAELLRGWRELLAHKDFGEHCPIDLIPHNVVVRPDGTLAAIDDEFRVAGWTRDQVERRGLYWTAYHLAERTTSLRWPGVSDAGALAVLLADRCGIELPEGWEDDLADRESAFQATVTPWYPLADHRRWWFENLRRPVGATLGLSATGGTDPQRLAGLTAELSRAGAELADRTAELTAAQEQLAAAAADQAKWAEFRTSRSYRVISGYRSVMDRVRHRIRRSR